MKRILSCLFLIAFLTACNPPVQQAPEVLAPTPYPDTPAPAAINAPIVEAPAIVSLDMLDEVYGWAVSEKQILRTNDGGMTWYNVTPPDVSEVGYAVGTAFLDLNHAWVQVPDLNNYRNKGTLHRTSDGGVTWTSVATPFSGGDMSFLDARNGWMLADLGVGAGSNAVAVFQTNDGGSKWSRTYTNEPNITGAGDSLPLSGLKYDLTPLTMQTAWVGGVIYAPGTVYLYRTDDSGHTWTQVSLPLPPGAENAELSIEHLAFVTSSDAFLSMRMTSDTIQVAVYVSQDAGKTWALTPTLIPQGRASDFLSVAEGILFNGDQFYVTRDAAHTWTIIPPDVVFAEMFAGMDFVNTSTGWVLTADVTNHRALYKTTDGGATWIPLVP